MTIDKSGIGPPPPSAQAVQLAELRRAELLTVTRSQTSPWWMAIVTGAVFAVDIWAFTLPMNMRGLVIGILSLSAGAVQFFVQRRSGVVLAQGRTPAGLAAPTYWTFGYMALGGVGLMALWGLIPWPAVAALGFLLGTSAHLLLQRKMGTAARDIEAEALGPPSEAGQ